MVVKSTTYTKNCSGCGKEQSYGRPDRYKAAVRGDWKCKSCSNSSNNFKGKIGPMPVTKQQYTQDYFVEMCKAVADKVKW